MNWQSTLSEQRLELWGPIAVCSSVDGVLEMGTLCFLIASASSGVTAAQ
jgi:hypothetical protein